MPRLTARSPGCAQLLDSHASARRRGDAGLLGELDTRAGRGPRLRADAARAKWSTCRRARRRWISPTTCTPRSAIAAAAPRSTAASCRWTTVLHSGDRVEIMTGKIGEPRRDWLVARPTASSPARVRAKRCATGSTSSTARATCRPAASCSTRELKRLGLAQADLAPAAAATSTPRR